MKTSGRHRDRGTSTNAILAIIAAIVPLALGVLGWRVSHDSSIPVPDEKEVAMRELAARLSGPRYFGTDEAGMWDTGGPWIGTEHADAQVERICRERNWGEDDRKRLRNLIGQLSESQPSRMLGGERIQLARLNLGLDAINP